MIKGKAFALLFISTLLVFLFLLLLSSVSRQIEEVSAGRVFTEAEEVPGRKVALVLGCSRYLPDGRQNLYFRYRILAAQELYETGKVAYLLVSGDNSKKGYDEPTDMKDALMELGIPEEIIVCDYAGFTTLDSVVRARKVFQEESLIVVSQEFHVRRAIYIGQNYDIDLVGYAAKDVTGVHSIRTNLRENLARLRAFLDVNLIRRNPTFLGEPVFIGK